MRPLLLLLAACAAAAPAAQREIVITIDDLPVAHSGPGQCDFDRLREQTSRLLTPLAARRIPATGFAIAGNCPDLTPAQRRQIYKLWRDAGAEIGNHTYSHPALSRTPIADYEQDILRADGALRQTLAVDRVRYFRWPMLHTGNDEATAVRLRRFLTAHQYREGPVTFDNCDWLFSNVYALALAKGEKDLAERARTAYLPYMESIASFFEKRSVEVVGREFPQILLLHANALNARMLPELLDMLERRGYRFVSLEHALRDPAYKLPDAYTGPRGISWLHRWAFTKGMPERMEPEDPEWLMKEWKRLAGR